MMEQVACGEAGLLLDYFYSLTPREFGNIIKGFRKRENDNMQAKLVIMRNLMYASLAPYQKKGNNFTPMSVMKFDWEKAESADLGADAPSEEQLQEIMNTWAFIDSQNKTKTDC